MTDARAAWRWSRTNQLILAAAARLGVRGEPIASEHSDFFLRLIGPDGAGVVISKTRSPFLTQVAQTLANNKFVSRELLGAAGIPVVEAALFDEASDPGESEAAAARARACLAAHGRVVVKPNWGNRGIGVVTDVVDLPGLVAAYRFAREHDRDEEVLVEPQLAGINLRVAVIAGEAVAAAEVVRPRLLGDGQRSIAELIAAFNHDPRRGSWDRPGLQPLDRVEDELVAELLEARGGALELASTLARGEAIELCFEEHEVHDRSDAVHPAWMAVAAEAADRLGVDVAGVDLRGLPEDLFERPPGPSSSARVLEVNALPALHLHALPTHGQAQPVFERFVAYCLQLPGALAVRASVRV
jgi:D-alanine-D-alanine ligase-like ATP-grasp enzyme